MDPFVYIPPTPETAPKHAAIRDAHTHAIEVCTHSVEQAGVLDARSLFTAVNAATKAFHDTIAERCPPSADTSAAMRCVRLARMACNEAIVCLLPGGIYTDADDNLRRCLDNLIAARWQACAAIALGSR